VANIPLATSRQLTYTSKCLANDAPRNSSAKSAAITPTSTC